MMKIKVLVFFVAALFAVNSQAVAQDSATILLEKAQVQAKKEGKKILVKFEASWCGWCHRMTKNMKAESTKKIFEDNFVMVPVVVFEPKAKKNLENPGGVDLIKKYNNGNTKVGLPFWFVLDADLKLVTNSYDSKNQNLGCPASPEEVEEFIKKLKKHASKFDNADAELIRKQFVLKK